MQDKATEGGGKGGIVLSCHFLSGSSWPGPQPRGGGSLTVIINSADCICFFVSPDIVR